MRVRLFLNKCVIKPLSWSAFLTSSTTLVAMSNKRENHELWWSRNLGKQSYLHNGEEVSAPSLNSFGKWMGDSQSQDRKQVRSLFSADGTFLDVGCGAAPENEGLKQDKPGIIYTGIDITPELVEFNQSRGVNCVKGSATALPFENMSFDMVHCRHVVEHMSNIEAPLNELIRVAIKQVYVVFFIGPRYFVNQTNLDNIGTDGEVFHNIYSRRQIRKILKSNHRVKQFRLKSLSKPSTYVLIIDLL